MTSASYLPLRLHCIMLAYPSFLYTLRVRPSSTIIVHIHGACGSSGDAYIHMHATVHYYTTREPLDAARCSIDARACSVAMACAVVIFTTTIIFS
mmetsp:Transcript_16614/g.46004  ORF Transcript_16614/g.46004 Transcript_16614/m.46004 type:complete len:95 (+) Transcript_16614:1217-1501(+)